MNRAGPRANEPCMRVAVIAAIVLLREDKRTRTSYSAP